MIVKTKTVAAQTEPGVHDSNSGLFNRGMICLHALKKAAEGEPIKSHEWRLDVGKKEKTSR